MIMYMKRLYGIIAFLFLIPFAYGQNVTSDPLQKEFNNTAIEKYGDPAFPKRDMTISKDEAWKNFINQNIEYSRSHPPFPKYNNTGNAESDQKEYDKAAEEWFANNPYYPQCLNTGNPKEDFENYEKARREWIKRNPDKFTDVYDKAQQEFTSKQSLYPVDGSKPQYINTGNKIEDDTRYKTAKLAWLKNNQEQLLKSNPERFVPSDTEKNKLKREDFNKIPEELKK